MQPLARTFAHDAIYLFSYFFFVSYQEIRIRSPTKYSINNTKKIAVTICNMSRSPNASPPLSPTPSDTLALPLLFLASLGKHTSKLLPLTFYMRTNSAV